MTGFRILESTLRDIEYRLNAGQINIHITSATNISNSTMKRLRERWNATGTIFAIRTRRPGPKPLVTPAMFADLELQYLQRSTLYQDEIQYFF